MRPTTEDVQAASDAALIPNSRKLTAKQRKFARALAMGATKADAYRSAYDVTSEHSVRKDPYTIAANPSVRQEVAAIEAAIAAQEYQTPAALRALVVNSLVKVITDPDSKPGQITAAAKVLGTVTEVAAFTERKEVRTISSSEDARAKIMAELRELVKAQAEDATVIDAAADSLLAELAPIESRQDADADDPILAQDEPHRPGTPHAGNRSPVGRLHINPHEQNPSFTDPHEQSAPPSENSPDEDPTPSHMEDPPVDGT